MAQKTLVTIVGPTAVGKTALSIFLANQFDCPIISCDSRQFFKEMTIGTAVPSAAELKQAEHYFIQNRSITDEYSIGSYEKDALELLTHLWKTHDVIVMVGGSTMYEKAITEGLHQFPEVPDHIYQYYNDQFEQRGIAILREELFKIDPVYYHSIDLQNPRRLIRALAINRSSNKNMTYWQSFEKQPREFNILKIGLDADRDELYSRIDKRVDIMLKNGLLDEARSLSEFQHLRSLQTVGYQELFPYFDGKYDLEEAVRLIKRNSRRYAKRQMTWYRKDATVNWFNYKTRHAAIARRVKVLLTEFTD
ncbi:MAG: tRNA (adenosine(37)-N6)-dimethylallyltransferase MiaA [Nonlabens sp.]